MSNRDKLKKAQQDLKKRVGPEEYERLNAAMLAVHSSEAFIHATIDKAKAAGRGEATDEEAELYRYSLICSAEMSTFL